MNEDRKILLQLIAGLTLCDNMGDVADEIEAALKRIGYAVEGYEGDYLASVRKMLHIFGITTMYGTSLASDQAPQ